MSDIAAKLAAIDIRFRKPSKQRDAARYIVQQNREIPPNERDAICQQIPIAKSTLSDLFTELRKMELYPPQETSDISIRPPTTERPKEISHQVPEAPQPSLEYVTKEDFETQFELLRNSTKEDLETLKNSINFLASVVSGEEPSNPGEDEEKEDIELVAPEELFIQEGSRTRQSIWIKPKTQMYFDMAKQGVFHNYAGTQELGPFAQFDGNISDFFNTIVDDYFSRNYYAEIGLTMRRYVK